MIQALLTVSKNRNVCALNEKLVMQMVLNKWAKVIVNVWHRKNSSDVKHVKICWCSLFTSITVYTIISLLYYVSFAIKNYLQLYAYCLLNLVVSRFWYATSLCNHTRTKRRQSASYRSELGFFQINQHWLILFDVGYTFIISHETISFYN